LKLGLNNGKGAVVQPALARSLQLHEEFDDSQLVVARQ
jgi:hypothetical protein